MMNDLIGNTRTLRQLLMLLGQCMQSSGEGIVSRLQLVQFFETIEQSVASLDEALRELSLDISGLIAQ